MRLLFLSSCPSTCPVQLCRCRQLTCSIWHFVHNIRISITSCLAVMSVPYASLWWGKLSNLWREMDIYNFVWCFSSLPSSHGAALEETNYLGMELKLLCCKVELKVQESGMSTLCQGAPSFFSKSLGQSWPAFGLAFQQGFPARSLWRHKEYFCRNAELEGHVSKQEAAGQWLLFWWALRTLGHRVFSKQDQEVHVKDCKVPRHARYLLRGQ